jgi:hypothetical protein
MDSFFDSKKTSDIYNKKTTVDNSFSDFMKSNSTVSTIIFIILIVIIFIILFQIIIWLTVFFTSDNNYWFGPTKLTSGQVIADNMNGDNNSAYTITQNPKLSSSKSTLFSFNQPDGIEFTWSFWINVNDLTYKSGEYKNVWVKGDNYYNNQEPEPEPQPEPNNNEPEPEPINNPDMEIAEKLGNLINGPGVYIEPQSNNLLFVFNTFNNIFETFTITDVPMQKWCNIIMVCKNRYVDVFINSSFIKRLYLSSPPKQNYNNVYIGKDGGFNGSVCDLWYYSYAIGTYEIDGIFKNGPNTTVINNNNEPDRASGNSNFLSYRWYLGNF